ncbi:hypothetical protein SAMN04487831_103260 [Pseudobutyrivibrio sp. UC1225]|uniref:hypothetical protein n=1 Tax=Pseudobutyrivibrio sp. UC1225 TaxID=1798185 RepID=UPI0008DEDF5B|nr:hypothetical protein [Pseudobutyrivibrio sp. UC1225]SFN77955.1 hypothetical protein SAMN04487831_103260 [Pseudobutyrivibrio sp. UC1225]
MTEAVDKKRIIFNVFLGLIVLVGSFYVATEGFYMDEAGLLATYKGIFQGNRMFIDSWGPYQLGGILTYPLFALYYYALEPVLYPLGIGFMLYTRICYQIIRLLIAIYLYATIKKTEYEKGAFLTALTYYVLFISYKNFSYKSMCDFGIVLFICWAVRFFDTRNRWFFLPMGLATCVMILSYPTMIIFPVFVVISLIVLMYNGYELGKPTIIYIVTCVVVGVAVVIYLQLTSGIMNIIPQLAYIEDSAYKNPMYVRFGMMLLSYLVFFVIAYAPVVVLKIIGFIRGMDDETAHVILSIYWILFMVASIIARPESVSASRFVYGCLIIFWWLPFFVEKREKLEYTRIGHYKLPEHEGKGMLKIIFFISVVVQLIWSISTNQGITVPGYMCFYVVLIVVMLAASEEVLGLKLLATAVVGFALFFSLVWVAESDGGYNDIFESRYYVTDGAYKGIALDQTDYDMNKAAYDLVTEYVTSEDKLFVLHGYSYSAYLNSDAKQGAGSPYSRAGKGQMRVLQYWEVNPENQPDYIMINPSNKYYDEFVGGETEEYINENYKTTVATEGDFILLAR